jgi:hypothetical protein
MHPEISQMVNAARSRDMRQQAAAWRRAREARSTPRARSVSLPLAVVAHLARTAASLLGQKQMNGPAAA